MEDFKKEMMRRYGMNEMRLVHHFFNIEVYQDDIGVFICQKKFVERILKILKIFGCKLINVPLIVNEKLMKDDGEKKVDAIFNRCLVGNLLYFSYKAKCNVCNKFTL